MPFQNPQQPTIPNDSTIQKIKVSEAGILVGTRQQLNFIEGSNITLDVVDNPGANRVDVTVEATASGGTQTIVRGQSMGTEQASILIPPYGAGDPKFTLGYAILNRPNDGKIYTLTRFATRLGSFDGPNMTISDDFTIGVRKVNYTTGTSNVTTINYNTGDGSRSLAAKTVTLNTLVAAEEDIYVWAAGAFPGVTLSSGPISWELIYTIT